MVFEDLIDFLKNLFHLPATLCLFKNKKNETKNSDS